MAKEIYAFFCLVGEEKKYFYVGRTKNFDRRIQEHNYRKTHGREDKYEFIRDLEEAGIGWSAEVIERVEDDDYLPDSERWHVIRLTREGHVLKNMRHGSVEHRRELSEQVRAKHIRSAATVRADRIRRKFLQSKRLRRRVWKSNLTKSGLPDIETDKTIPPVFRRRLLARIEASGSQSTSFPAGWSLSDFVHYLRRPLSSIRATRKTMEELEASLLPLPAERRS